MSEDLSVVVSNIGKKVQFFRKRKNYTLKLLANMIGATPSLLSQIEHGKASPSISTVKSLADAFEVPISALFEAEYKELPGPVIKRSQYKRFTSGDDISHYLLNPGWKDFEIYLNEYPPDSTTGETAVVLGGHQCGHVIKGQLVIEIDGEEYTAETGDSVLFAGNRPHRIINRGSETAQAVWVATDPWQGNGVH